MKQNLIDEEESHDRKREKKRKADKVKKAKEKQSVQDKLTEFKRNNAPSKTYTNLGGIENGIYNTRAIREDTIKNVAQAPVIQLTAASAVEQQIINMQLLHQIFVLAGKSAAISNKRKRKRKSQKIQKTQNLLSHRC